MERPREEGENGERGHPAPSVMDGTRRAHGGLSPTGEHTQKGGR